MLAGAWGPGCEDWEVMAKGYRVSCWGYKNILKLNVVMVVQLYEYTTAIELYTLKWVNCMVHELYLKAVTKKTLI